MAKETRAPAPKKIPTPGAQPVAAPTRVNTNFGKTPTTQLRNQ